MIRLLKGLMLPGIISVIISGEALAQNKLPSIDYRKQSPAAAAFSRYGEIPVDHSTGVPKIEVPVYTMKVGDINVPMTISYHSSGIKVRDVATEVGLGFVLNTGGVVTATIIGKADVDSLWPIGYNSYRKASDIDDSITNAYASSNQTKINELAEHHWRRLNPDADYHPIVDNFSDRFQYSLCTGESGVFRKDFVNDTIRLMPYRPIKVEIGNFPYLNITSADGYRHYFTASDKDYYALTKVVSADKTDSILYFHSYNTVHRLDVDYSVTWQYEECYLEYDPLVCGIYTPCLKRRTWNSCDPEADGGMSATDAPLLDSIITKNEVIHFTYVKDRYDDLFATMITPLYNRLSKITVKDRLTRQNIKEVDLFHSYFGNSTNKNRRLKLDSLQFLGKSSTVGEKYSFKYDTTHVLPSYPHLNGPYIDDIWHEDYWGYYNGSVEDNLFPDFFYSLSIPTSTIDYGYLEPDFNYAKACILTEIKYPTGGKTVFEYEANNAPGLGAYTGGGARIKKITNYTDPSSIAKVKTYQYDDSYAPGIYSAYYKWDSPEENYVYHKRPSSLIWDEEYYDLYKGFSNSLRPITVGGTAIVYTQVTEYEGDTANNNGKTVYRYSSPEIPESRYSIPGSIDTRYISYYHADCGNYVPELLTKTIYKRNVSSYDTVQYEEHNYAKFRQKTFNTGISIGSKIVIHNWGAATPLEALSAYDNDFSGPHEYLSSLVYCDTKAFEESSLETDNVVRVYSGINQYVATKTFFEYDVNYLLLTRKKVLTSMGDTLTDTYEYPADFPSVAPYTTMVTRNILNPIIKESTFKNSTFLQYLKTNYDYWDGNAWSVSPTNLILPKTIESKTLSASPETRITYHSYNPFGDVTSVSKDAGVKNSYIWDYNNNFPICSSTGAELSSIAYTSFEAEGNGNWTYSGTPITDFTSPTGKKSYLVLGNPITKTGLPSATYIVSYWGRNNSASVNSAGPTRSGKQLNNWRYYEHEVIGTSITITGSEYIDELRLYPKGAQMSTYTYEPHNGISSECDVANRITKYEYDPFGRLSFVRDENNKIIKRFCYNYSGQPENCSISGYVSAAVSGSFTRNNCGTGYTGTSVTYNVPAGAYFSTVSQAVADQLAQDDLSSNGQAYANANGSCNCDTTTCSAPSKKCMMNTCFTGELTCLSTVWDKELGLWVCSWYYLFSFDCSSQFAYTTTSATPCTTGFCH